MREGGPGLGQRTVRTSGWDNVPHQPLTTSCIPTPAHPGTVRAKTSCTDRSLPSDQVHSLSCTLDGGRSPCHELYSNQSEFLVFINHTTPVPYDAHLDRGGKGQSLRPYQQPGSLGCDLSLHTHQSLPLSTFYCARMEMCKLRAEPQT